MSVFNARSKNNETNNPNDHFVTPDWCIKVLVNYLYNINFFKKDITNIQLIDFCCGCNSLSNKMLKVIEQCNTVPLYNTTIYSSDIEQEVTEKTNFFKRLTKKITENKLNVLIMNPPYNKKDLFISKSLEFVNEVDNSLCALLLPTTSLNGIKRKKIYQKYNTFLHLLVLSKRPQFMTINSSNVDCSWFIWSTKFKESKICWN